MKPVLTKPFACFLFLLAVLAIPHFTTATEANPRGDVFNPLFADPKEIRSTVNLFGVSVPGHYTAMAFIGFGEHWGLLRWNGKHPKEGWQVGITGGVFAQFDLHTASKDLINADYLVGFPISWRRGRTSARFRVYHQSSHLGDEYLLGQHPERINLSFEANELIVSQELGPWRLYAGGEWLFLRSPTEMKPFVAHAGLEYRTPIHGFFLAPDRSAHWTVAIDAKMTQEYSGTLGCDFKTGVEFGPRKDADPSSRRWSLTAEYYVGPSPYSQYFYEEVKYGGAGFQLGL